MTDNKVVDYTKSIQIFKQMVPSFEAFLKSITGRDIEVTFGTTSAMISSNLISIIPNPDLGKYSRHTTALCDTRDPRTGEQTCDACRVREAVWADVYHEAGHLVGKSYETMPIPGGATTSVGAYAAKQGAEFFALFNALDDTRIENLIRVDNPGIAKMLDINWNVLRADGIYDTRTGEQRYWRDIDQDMQAILGVHFIGYKPEMLAELDEYVQKTLDDDKLHKLIDECGQNSKQAQHVFAYTGPIKQRLTELGFFTPIPEPEPENSDNKGDDNAQDDNGDSEGGSPQETGEDSPERMGEPGGTERESCDGDSADADGDSEADGSNSDSGLQDGENREDVPDASRGSRESESSNSGENGQDSPEPDNGDAPQDSPSDAMADASEEPDEQSDNGSGDSDGDCESDSEQAGNDSGDERSEGTAKSSGKDDAGPDPDGQDGTELGEPSPDDRVSEEADGDFQEQSDGKSTNSNVGVDGSFPETSENGDSSSSQCNGERASGPGAEHGTISDGSLDPDGSNSEADATDSDGTVNDGDSENESGINAGQGSALANEAISSERTDELRTDGEPEGGTSSYGTERDDSPEPQRELKPSVNYADAGLGCEIAQEHANYNGKHAVSFDEETAITEALYAVAVAEKASTESAQTDAIDIIAGDLGISMSSNDPTGEIEISAWEDAGNGQWTLLRGRGTTTVWNGKTDVGIVTRAFTAVKPAFMENKRSKFETGMRSGKINTRSLGRKFAVEDDRIFRQRRIPKKRDYFACITIDMSGSTSNNNRLENEKAAAAHHAEIMQRLGIKFEIWGNHSKGTSLALYPVKLVTERWTDKSKQKLAALKPAGGNRDPEMISFARRRLDAVRATDKICFFYTDGYFPDQPLLQQELALYRKTPNYTLVGVGFDTDSPTKYGLPTVEIHNANDLPALGAHLTQLLLKG